MERSKEKFSGYLVVAGCTIVIFCHLGTCGIISVMMPYFVEKFGATIAAVAGSTSLGACMGFLSNMTTGRVIKKLSPRGTLFLGTAFCALFMFMNCIASELWMLYVANGLSGFILGYGAQVTCASLINNWFIEKRATMLGIVFAGNAVGAAFFMFLTGQLIARYNQFTTYAVMFIISIGGALFAEIFLIRNNPEIMGQKPLGRDSIDSDRSALSEKQHEIDPAAAKKTSAFFLMAAATFLGAMLYGGFTFFAPSFWMSKGITPTSAATYASIVSLLGAVVSMGVGYIADKWGLKTYMFALFGCYIAGIVMAITWGTVLPVIMVLIANILFISAGTPIQGLSSTVTKPVFGSKASDSINSVLMAFFWFGVMVCNFAFGLFADITGSFIPGFLLLLVFSVITLGLMLTALRKSPMTREYQKAV